MAYTRGLLVVATSILLLLLVNASAANFKSAKGTGAGTFECAGIGSGTGGIAFSAEQDGQTVSGTGVIAAAPGGVVFSIDDGRISDARRFRFSGIVTVSTGCEPARDGFILTGLCGTSTTIFYEDDAGNRGAFDGRVDCVK